MRKLVTILFAALAVSAGARQISPDEAASIASKFFNPASRSSEKVAVSQATDKTVSPDSPQPYYVFNGQDNSGFVIVSGDDRTRPILGYSDAGNFDFNNLPPQLEWLLGEYANEIEALASSPETSAYTASADDTRAPIEPLIKTHWGQDEPFNNSSPLILGKRAVTGCVATALAQVMNYHKWPERGRGSHSYQCGWTYSIDFSEIEFDWDAMLDGYPSNCSERSKEAVATLMKACGYSLNTLYLGAHISAAQINDVISGACSFFDYSPKATNLYRSQYTDEEWEIIIYNQLSNGLPVIYAGEGEDNVGHCFVCDGYDKGGYFHFNWGWRGASDGYYLLSAQPTNLCGYALNQTCIIDFFPSTSETEIISDGIFTYCEISDGNLSMIGTVDSNQRLAGDVVLPDEIEFNGAKYSVTKVSCYLSDILDVENLTSLDIKSPMYSIPVGTFSGATNLKHISFPSTLQKISYFAFKNCSGLTGSLIIPNSIITIGRGAFYGCSGFTGSLEIPNSITYIDIDTFNGCSGLTGELTIPNSVKSIGDYAFRGCRGLTGDLTIPNSVTSIGDHAFDGCSGFTGVLTIPNSITSIGSGAFWDCSGLTGELTIPNSITSIGDYAFCSCRGLTGALTIPNSVTFIDNNAFDGCSGLTGNLNIPNSVTSIGNRAFFGCSGLTGDLIIPNSVTSIGEEAFSDCHGFNGSLSIGDEITVIEDSSFKGCSGFTGSLAIPNSVTSIGNSAFSKCSGFNGTLTIPNSVTTIGAGAFDHCSGFTGSLTIPNSVTSIGNAAFFGCSGFNGTLTISKAVTTIKLETFAKCSGFTGPLIIPSNVTYIGDYAFNTYGIKNFKISSSVPRTNLSTHSFNLSDFIGIPTGSGADYRAIEEWGTYKNLYEFGDANIDKKLTISDAVAVANNIIGVENSSFNEFIADINYDEVITVNDAARIVNAVLTYNPSGADQTISRTMSSDNGTLAADDFSLTATGKAAVGVRLSGCQPVVALQCDFITDAGTEIDEIAPDASIAETHTLKTHRLDDGRVRLVLYSLENKSINLDNRPLFTIHLRGNSGSLHAEMISASTPDATDIELRYVGGNNMGQSGIIDNVKAEMSIIGSNGTLTVLNAEGMRVEIVGVDGRRISSFTATSNAESRQLQTGIYIVRIANTTTKVIL